MKVTTQFSLSFLLEIQTNELSDVGPCKGKSQPVKAKLSFGWVKRAYLFIQRCCLETEKGDSLNLCLKWSKHLSVSCWSFCARIMNKRSTRGRVAQMKLLTEFLCVTPCRKSGGRILQEFLRRRWPDVSGGVKRWLLTKASLQSLT